MAGVVSETEKAGRVHQACAGKTNVSGPLATCRKRRDVMGSGLKWLARDQARVMPADSPSDDRHQGGVRPAQALVGNVGPSGLDVKGELQADAP
jgi:hypothetical protein